MFSTEEEFNQAMSELLEHLRAKDIGPKL